MSRDSLSSGQKSGLVQKVTFNPSDLGDLSLQQRDLDVLAKNSQSKDCE